MKEDHSAESMKAILNDFGERYGNHPVLNDFENFQALALCSPDASLFTARVFQVLSDFGLQETLLLKTVTLDDAEVIISMALDYLVQ